MLFMLAFHPRAVQCVGYSNGSCRLPAGCQRLGAQRPWQLGPGRGGTEGGAPKWLPAQEPAILPRLSPGSPSGVLPSQGVEGDGAGRVPACLVAAGEAAVKAVNVPAFCLTQDCCEFSPPLCLLVGRRKRAGRGAPEFSGPPTRLPRRSRLGLRTWPRQMASPWPHLWSGVTRLN